MSRKRKSKWDVPGDQQGQTGGESNVEQRNSFAADATQKARERAAQLAAKLASEGKLASGAPPPHIVIPQGNVRPSLAQGSGTNVSKDQNVPDDPDIVKIDSGGYMADFEINDLPSRVNLTKKAVQERIAQQSGAAISTRGKFMQPEEKRALMTAGEKPLFLSIQAPIQAKVQVALHMIKDVIRNFGKPDGGLKLFNGTQNTALSYVQDKVFVGLEHAAADYNVKEKLEGPNGSFFQHIVVQTGAKVHLRGRGSGFLEPTSGRESFEPLHIYVSHPNQGGLYQAKSLCENLVQSVHNDLKNWNQANRIPTPFSQAPFSQDYNKPLSSGHGIQPVAYPSFNQPPSNYTSGQPQPNMPPNYPQPQHVGSYPQSGNYPPPQYPHQAPTPYAPQYQGSTAYSAPRQDSPFGYPPQNVPAPPQSFQAQEQGQPPSGIEAQVYPNPQVEYSGNQKSNQENTASPSTHNRPERKRRRFTEDPDLIRQSTDTKKIEESHSHSLDSNTKFRSTGEGVRGTSRDNLRREAHDRKDIPPGTPSSSKKPSQDFGKSFKAPSLPLSSGTKKKSKSRTSDLKNPLASLIPYTGDSDSDSD